jgi:cytoskeletal protein RodZ
VTQVSQQTCIRETIIRGIEHDDCCACGGDFYARGHIRAIAHAVRVDPEPLIAEYDAAHHAPHPVTAADLLRPARPVRIRERHRLNWTAVLALALAAVLGLVTYRVMTGAVITGPRRAPRATTGAAARPHQAIGHHPRHATPHPAATPAPNPYAHEVAIHLVATGDCWVQFTTPAGGYLFQLVVPGGTTKTWTFRHAVDMRLGDPVDVTLTVDGKNPLPPGTTDPITLSLGLDGKISS